MHFLPLVRVSQKKSIRFSDLWAAKLNLRGRASLATREELDEYERKREELEIELERRKELGEKFAVR